MSEATSGTGPAYRFAHAGYWLFASDKRVDEAAISFRVVSSLSVITGLDPVIHVLLCFAGYEDLDRLSQTRPLDKRRSHLMFLIGQYDSPFVRRVAIALRLYGLPFDHRPLSTFGDADQIAPFNPLRRVPTLVLDDGEALIDSTAILDYLDELVGPDKAMIDPRGAERRRDLRTIALATGLGDKSVSLVYESVLRKEQLKLWVERCEAQISGALDALEKTRAAVTTPYLFGSRIGHADIALACILRFTGEAHPHLLAAAHYPALIAHAAQCEALPPFKEIVQPLSPPKG